MEKRVLNDEFEKIKDYWSPCTLGYVDNYAIKIAKMQGEFPWHQHENEDEFFLVVKGSLIIQLRDKDVHLNEGEFFIVPKQTEHRPIATQEVWVMLFEAVTTKQYGDGE